MLLTAGILTQYTNCAESLPGNLNQPADLNSQSSNLPDQNSLQLTINPQTILVNQTAQVTVTGGVAPYIYTATAGTASVSTTGLVTGLGVGAGTIEVTDQNGNHSSISVSVVTSTAPVANTAACRTAYGQMVPHGGQVNVYASATVACPATCTAQTQTCNNGTLVGTFTGQSGTCSVNACVYKITTTGNCPVNGITPPFYPAPANCSAAEVGKYICATPGITKMINEYQCSSP